MVEEWLDHYRHISRPIISQQTTLSAHTFSSDGEYLLILKRNSMYAFTIFFFYKTGGLKLQKKIVM
jgi:hypothetical protein